MRHPMCAGKHKCPACTWVSESPSKQRWHIVHHHLERAAELLEVAKAQQEAPTMEPRFLHPQRPPPLPSRRRSGSYKKPTRPTRPNPRPASSPTTTPKVEKGPPIIVRPWQQPPPISDLPSPPTRTFKITLDHPSPIPIPTVAVPGHSQGEWDYSPILLLCKLSCLFVRICLFSFTFFFLFSGHGHRHRQPQQLFRDRVLQPVRGRVS